MRLTRFFSLIGFLVAFSALASAGEVYINDSAGNLYAGNPATGVFSLIGNDANVNNEPMGDIDFTSNGQLWGIGYDNNLYSINAGTGAATLVGATGIGFVAGAAGDSFGNLYAGGTNNIYTINTATGAGTQVGAGGGGYTVSGDLEFVGSTLYATSAETASGGTLWQINQGTGFGTFIGETGFDAVWGLAYDTDNGIFYGYTSGGQEFTINPANLALDTAVNTNLPSLLGSNQLFGAAFGSAVPEPSTWATLLGGAALIAAFIIRRRTARA